MISMDYDAMAIGNHQANLRLLTAGNLPGSVLAAYDLSGIYVRGRLPYAG